VTVLPESVFMAQINQNLRTTLILTLLALVGAIAIFTTHYLVRPIERITLASAQLADGQLQQQPGSPIQELQTLAHSFNRMAAQLNTQRLGSQRHLSLSFLNYCGGKIKTLVVLKRLQ
jgi:nitrogen fixation/metabolism regulation signal transduction histidine kinase